MYKSKILLKYFFSAGPDVEDSTEEKAKED